MNYFEHFYPYIKELLCREEEAQSILKAAEAINSINPANLSEAEIVMFIKDRFDSLIYGTGHEYNYPGYNAVHQLGISLKNLDMRIMYFTLQAQTSNAQSAS